MMYPTGANNLRVCRAFTLVELMISVLILGFGLTSVANSYIMAVRGVNAAQNNISALMIIKEKFDNLEFTSLKGVKPAIAAEETIKGPIKEYKYQQAILKLPEFAGGELADAEPVSAEAISPEPATVESDYLAKFLVSACSTLTWPEKNSSKNVTLATYLLRKK
ncbi:MAG: prepilin-type N-terminal cleavage/methylation domain-containing protein [Candidatus Omnitrophica bacterium]|nr:prepilin-type N-terminal cleavage/methylation domain-containing protein [Candidatus Omnitrophota bacterium]